MTFRFLGLNGVRYLKNKVQQMTNAAISRVTPESIGAARWGGLFDSKTLNIDSIHRAGFYGVSGLCKGQPRVDAAGYLLVLDYSGTNRYGAQIFVMQDTVARVFCRISTSDTIDTWTPWAAAGDFAGGSFTIDGSASTNWIHMGIAGKIYSNDSDRTINMRFDNGLIMTTGNGGAYAPILASAFKQGSSRRYKENIVPLSELQARALLRFEIVQYDYKVGEKNQFGVIAEDIVNIQPQGVYYDSNGAPDSIDYSKFVPQLIKLCQMQQEQINALEKRVCALEILK
ncbi:MAG: pyocin knob domain-containing S74 family peptidase [Ruthenibacterium sp.]